MTASPQLMPDTVCVAIDIAKRYHDVLIRWPMAVKRCLKCPTRVLGISSTFSRPLASESTHRGNA